MKSIQTKFVILILSCVVLCSIIIGGGAILRTKKVVDSDSIQFMNLQCQAGAEKFNNQLARIEQSVKTLAIFTLEQLKSVEKLGTDAEYLKDFTRQLETISLNAASNTDGALAVYVRFNPELTPPDSGFFWSKTNSNRSFQKLPPTNLSDYAATDTEHVGWYYAPVQRGKAMWMAPYINENVDINMVSYVVPLYKNTEVVGVVGMDIDFGLFESLAKNIKVYDTGYAFLCDEKGTIMYHPKYKTGEKIEDIEQSLQPVVTELKNKTSASSLFTYKQDKQVKRMAYRALNNGMQLVITAPLNDINSERNGLIVQSLIAILLISIFFVFLTVAVTSRIIRPLKELNNAAKKIADGDLNISLTKKTKDEVGTLSDSFQLTVNQLQKYISYINGLAFRDALTGVKNKGAYQEAERRIEDQMRISQPQFAVVVLDINNLKQVNDRFGHDFGDMLLIDACKFICKIFKHSPVYRIGGDEFATILENNDFDNYAALMEEFGSKMNEYNSSVQPDSRFTIARGIAVYNSEIDLVFASVFKRADDCMYKNKAAMKARLEDNSIFFTSTKV